MNKNKGFTLVELLAVVVILGVLLLIAVPAVTTLIDKTKKQTFISECELILQAAKYEAVSMNNEDKYYYNIKDLDLKNKKDNYKGGVFRYDINDDGNDEWYIYVYDENTGRSLGTNAYGQIEMVSQDEISVSNLSEVPVRFQEDVINNLDNGLVNFKVENYNFESNEYDDAVKKSEAYELGEKVYIKNTVNRMNGESSCRMMTVLHSNAASILLLDQNSIGVNRFNDITYYKTNKLQSFYHKIALQGYNIDYHSLLTTNHLYYVANYDQYDTINENYFIDNKEALAKLFSTEENQSVQEFYELAKKQIGYPYRFIALGNDDNIQCSALGKFDKNSKIPCNAFSFLAIAQNKTDEVHIQFNPDNSMDSNGNYYSIGYNFVVQIKTSDITQSDDAKIYRSKSECQAILGTN